MLISHRLVLSFACLCALFGYVSESRADILGILKEHEPILDMSKYHDLRKGQADYWDCNGYSIRACQILLRRGIDCQIAVNGGHAFIFVPGIGYFEPQVGGVLGSQHLTGGIVLYPLDQYIATYNAAGCQANFADVGGPSGGGAQPPPAAGGAQPPPDSGVGQVGYDQPVAGPVVPPVATPGTFQHNGYIYECPAGTILVVYENGELSCQPNA